MAKTDATGGQGLTPFRRTLAELNVEMLCANGSQTKGRVERANRTLQDRLVKELALEGPTTMDQANAFQPGFVERFNAKFSVPPARPENAHRAVTLAHESLREVLCRRDMRYVGRQLSLSWKRRLLILERKRSPRDRSGNMWKFSISRMADWTTIQGIFRSYRKC